MNIQSTMIIKRSTILHLIVCSLVFLAVPITGEATVYEFVPGVSLTETYDAGGFLDDADVDVHSGAGDLLPNEPGNIVANDIIIWDYLYTEGLPGYKVTSSDKADIDRLQLFGSSTGETELKVELQFASVGGDLFGSIYTMNPVTWGANNAWVVEDTNILPGQYEGDDALGILQGSTICGFRMQMTFGSGGLTSFTQADFEWEAGTITKESCGDTSQGIDSGGDGTFFGNDVENLVPVPPAVWLFGSGLLGLISIARRRNAV